jgi:hypothetical protein
MNIFVLDENPILAARYQCDKHIVKMTVETSQLLCTAVHMNSAGEVQTPYKPTHVNHPCTKWASQTLESFEWLYKHGQALAGEYTYRYGKIHKCEAIINWCAQRVGLFSLGGLIPFVQAMPEQYKHEDIVQAYRAYYLGEKKKFAKWTRREPPMWWIQ